MIKIILTGHGNIASGVKSAIELVFGESENLVAVDFTKEITPEMLEEKIEKELLEKNLIFADIAGGTPFKTASLLSLKKEDIKVVGGMNLPMILEVLGERDYSSLEELYTLAIESGKNEVKGFEIKVKEIKEDNFEDGSLPLPCSCSISLCLSKMNKMLKKN